MISWFERHPEASWVLTIVAAVGIFWVSSLSFGSGVPGIDIVPILYHILSFFVLATFLLISLVGGQRKRLFVLGIVLAIVYGVSDELHQFFVPGRYMSLFDIFLDGIGVIFAAMIYFILVESRESKD